MQSILKNYKATEAEDKMFKTATLPDHQTPKNDLVHCANCGTPMTIVGADYVCLVNAEGGPDRCTTTSVDAESLVVQAVTQVLNRVINYSMTFVLAADVQQTVSEASSTQQERLQISESSIEELNRSKEQVLRTVEQNLTTYPEVAEVLNQINAVSLGLAYESHLAQEEIDKLAFIGDAEGLRQDAKDLVHNLEDVGPQETWDLLNIFVREIRVSPGLAEIFYSHPLPDEQNHPRIASDRIAIDL